MIFRPPRPRIAAALFLSLTLLAFARPALAAGPIQVTVQSATVGTEPREIVYNAAALAPIVEGAKTGRIDIAGIGDSNQIGGSTGWEHGYSKAWTDRYGEYATGVFGLRAVGGWDGPAGYINSWAYPFGAANDGAPADLHKYRLYTDSQGDGANDFPPSYAYFGPSFQETVQWTPVVNIKKQSGLYGQTLKWHVTYGTFDTGSGGFNPSVHSNGAQLLQGPRVNTSTGVLGLSDLSFTVPSVSYANATGIEISMGLSYPGQATMTGPFFGLWQRVEGEKQTGVGYSTMLWQGGRALVHAATGLQQQSDDALKEYVRNLVKLQGGNETLLVQVNHAQNDPGHTIPSVGPNPAPSHTPAGFADNMNAVITRLRGVWSAMGHDADNLVFQYGPYHPAAGAANDGTGRSVVQRLADYENAIVQLSQQNPGYNLAVVRGTRMTTPLTMTTNGWYQSPTDNAHLSFDGYVGVSELGVRQAIAYATVDELQNRSAVTSLSFQFDSDVSAKLSPDDLILLEAGNDMLMDPFNFAVDWDAATLTATWTFQGLPLGELPAGDYEATLRISELSGLAGAEGRGVSSGNFVFHFTAAPAPIPEPTAAMGAIALSGLALSRRRRA